MKALARLPMILLLVAGSTPAAGQTSALAGFEPFLGEWAMGDAVSTFEWGPGRSSVVGRSYQVREGERVLVSLGIWYWHPGEEAVAGRVSATGMPVALFEYETRVVDGALVSDLVAFGPDGQRSRYVETMELMGEDRYEWRLLQAADTSRVVMRGVFTRR